VTDLTDSRYGAGLTARRRSRQLRTVFGITALALALTGCSTGTSRSKPVAEPSYGGLPSFLPAASAVPDSVLTGTADRPALTTEGDSVEVQMPQASILVTVTGPEVPGEGLPYVTPATTCTWTVTLTKASAAVPITIAEFTTLDHLGVVYHPTLVAGQPVPPAVIKPGQTVTFELRVVMTVGEGLMRWAPGAQHIVASWDFEVEND